MEIEAGNNTGGASGRAAKSQLNYGYLAQVEDSVDTEEELIKHDKERQKRKTKLRKLRKGYHEVRLKEDDSTQGEDTPVHVVSRETPCVATEGQEVDEQLAMDIAFESPKPHEENKTENAEEFMLQHITKNKVRLSFCSDYICLAIALPFT
jgi:hypothetical protein